MAAGNTSLHSWTLRSAHCLAPSYEPHMDLFCPKAQLARRSLCCSRASFLQLLSKLSKRGNRVRHIAALAKTTLAGSAGNRLYLGPSTAPEPESCCFNLSGTGEAIILGWSRRDRRSGGGREGQGRQADAKPTPSQRQARARLTPSQQRPTNEGATTRATPRPFFMGGITRRPNKGTTA